MTKRITLALLALSLVASVTFFTLSSRGVGNAHAAPAVPKAPSSSVPLSVYFGSDYDQFYALDATSGALRWKYQYQNGGNEWSPANVVNSIVYFEVIGGSSDAVEALNTSDGSVV